MKLESMGSLEERAKRDGKAIDTQWIKEHESKDVVFELFEKELDESPSIEEINQRIALEHQEREKANQILNNIASKYQQSEKSSTFAQAEALLKQLEEKVEKESKGRHL